MEAVIGASTRIQLETVIHPQSILQMELETQTCVRVMAVGIAVSTLIQTTKVVPKYLALGQTCVFTTVGEIVVSTPMMMGHASHLL